MVRLLAALLLAAVPVVAEAHDTILIAPPGPKPARAPVELALSSIEAFPRLDYGPRADRVASATASSGTPVVLERTEQALRVRLVSPGPGLHAVNLTLKPYTFEMTKGEIAHYMDDIDASPALRERAAAAASWTETYVKHAKTLVCIDPCGDTRPALRRIGAALEFTAATPRLDAFVLSHEGRPLAGQAVALEWVGGARRFVRTDARGRVTIPAEATGPILLSAVRLVPPSREGGAWTSDFATLTFERPAGAPSRPKA